MLIVFCDYIGLHHNHTYFTWCLSMVFLLDCNQEFCHQCYWVVVDDYPDGRKIPMNEQENSMRRNWHGSSNMLVTPHNCYNSAECWCFIPKKRFKVKCSCCTSVNKWKNQIINFQTIKIIFIIIRSSDIQFHVFCIISIIPF